MADCHLGDLFSDIDSMTRQMAIDKGLEFKIIKTPPVPTIIRTDYVRLYQCLANLVINAIKFTKKGHVHIAASLDEQDNTMVRFDVVDTGVGIASDKLESIFESFSQVEETEPKQQTGTGLGLTITKHLAELLGGSISLSSKLGKGSVFSLTIPTGLDLDIQGIPASRRTEEDIETDTDDEQFVGEVLVAEDFEPLRIYTKELLECHGLNVTLAEHGKMAVQKAENKSFDLILMDLSMPQLNGYEALEHLRRKKVATPIIALTAHAMSGFEEICRRHGFDEYMSKPLDQHKLVQLLKKHLKTDEEG
jgi:two-component system CheB/CheR fusion protein